MLEIIIALALLPLALLGLLLLIGIVILTRRIITAVLVWIALAGLLFLTTPIDFMWGGLILYVCGAILWVWAVDKAEPHSTKQ